MRRTRRNGTRWVAITIVTALLAGACTGGGAPSPSRAERDRAPVDTSKGSGSGRQGSNEPAAPAALVLRSLRALPPAIVEAARTEEGVLAASEAPVFIADVESIDGKRPPSGDQNVVLPMVTVAVSPALLDQLPSGKTVSPVLRRRQVVVEERAAARRGIKVGSRLSISLNGSVREFRVGAVVPGDGLFRYEMMLPLSERAPDWPAHLFVVAAVPERADQVSSALRSAAGHAKIGIAPLESWAGHEVLTYDRIKTLFGEFSFRWGSKDLIQQDRAWVHSSIVSEHLPVLGEVVCHRRIMRQLSYAFKEIEREGLAPLIRSYDGCYVPRLQRGSSSFSLHAWGIAFDINASTNQEGNNPTIDARIVRIMKRWGFAWGGDFLIPDGMHFEFARFPSDEQYAEADGS